jgi:hypothetical protein
MRLDENTIGLWFTPMTAGDNLVSLRSDDGGKTFYGEGRVRHYDPVDPGNDAFSGKDQKNWYRVVIPHGHTKEQAVQWARDLANGVHPDGGYSLNTTGKVIADEILMDETGVQGFMEKMRTKDWCHTRVAHPDGSPATVN